VAKPWSCRCRCRLQQARLQTNKEQQARVCWLLRRRRDRSRRGLWRVCARMYAHITHIYIHTHVAVALVVAKLGLDARQILKSKRKKIRSVVVLKKRRQSKSLQRREKRGSEREREREGRCFCSTGSIACLPHSDCGRRRRRSCS
jgi:hypothetical protein